jgi:hypothetical protein
MTLDEMVASLPALREDIEAVLRARSLYAEEVNKTCHHCRDYCFGAGDKHDLPLVYGVDGFVESAARVIESQAREIGVTVANLKVRIELKAPDTREKKPHLWLIAECRAGPHLN